MTKYKKIICIFLILISTVSLSSCANKAENLVVTYFDCLSSLEFIKAGECVGDETRYEFLVEELDENESYLDYVSNESFIDFVYSSLECTVLSSEKVGEEWVVQCEITAYDVEEITKLHQDEIAKHTATQDYLAMESGEQYVSLCEFIPIIYSSNKEMLTRKQSTIDIKVVTDEGKLILVDGLSLYDAIAGKSL